MNTENKINKSLYTSGSIFISAMLIIMTIIFLIFAIAFYSDKNGIQEIIDENGNTHTYYYIQNKIQTGWAIINNQKYYFDLDGEMYRGFHVIDGKAYYFNPEKGYIDKYYGSKKIDDVTYYFDEYGAVKSKTRTGFYTFEDNETYYYNKSGNKVSGLQTIEENTYYFQPTTGRMLKNTQITIDNFKYTFGNDGIMTSKEPINE